MSSKSLSPQLSAQATPYPIPRALYEQKDPLLQKMIDKIVAEGRAVIVDEQAGGQ